MGVNGVNMLHNLDIDELGQNMKIRFARHDLFTLYGTLEICKVHLKLYRLQYGTDNRNYFVRYGKVPYYVDMVRYVSTVAVFYYIR